MAKLIRRSPRNLAGTPGLQPGQSLARAPIGQTGNVVLEKVESNYPLSNVSIDFGTGSSNLSLPKVRDTSEYTPTIAEKNVLSPQNVIGGQYVTVENIKSDFQTNEVLVSYSTGAPSAPSKPKPQLMSNKVVTSSNAAVLSKYVGRTLAPGERLSVADVQRINTPGSAFPSTGPSRGFTGGQGYGQAFPINPALFNLAQQAVNQERIRSLALKSAFRVKLSNPLAAKVSFQQVKPVSMPVRIVR